VIVLGFLQDYEVYGHLGVVGATPSCIGQSLILEWGSTPPQSVYNLCSVFRFGFATMSLVSLFLLPFQPRSHILHCFFWWVPVRLTSKKLVGVTLTYF
jgi:hypothetical protein